MDDVTRFLAVFAGPADEEDDIKEDKQDRDHVEKEKEREEEAYFPPSVFEWQPNPVILPHLRDEHAQSLDPGPSVVKDTSDCHFTDTAGAAASFCPDIAIDFDSEAGTKNDQGSSHAPKHTGPITMSVTLSSFACPQCTYVANKKFKLKYAINVSLMLLKLKDSSKHINQTHNHRFKCVHQSCGRTFGLRANLERHEATHTERKGFRCPNIWCSTPDHLFTREDNFKRHTKRCVITEQ